MVATVQADVLPLPVPVLLPLLLAVEAPPLLDALAPPLLDELTTPPLLLLAAPDDVPPLELLGAAFELGVPSGVDEQPADSATTMSAQPRP